MFLGGGTSCARSDFSRPAFGSTMLRAAMDDRRLEVKVGAFALVGLAVAAALVLALTGLHTGRSFVFHVDFAYAGGVPAGAAVKIAGVKVGRVRSVVFRPTAQDRSGRPLPVQLTLDIDREAALALRSDATATIGTQGALGESYVEVLPGTAPGPLPAGAEIRGLDPPRLDVLFAKLSDLLESAASGENFQKFLFEVAELAHTLNTVISAHQGDIGDLVGNLARTLDASRQALAQVGEVAKSADRLLNGAEVRSAVQDLSATAEVARAQLPSVLADTDALVKSLKKTTGALSPADVAKLKTTIAKYGALAMSLQHVSKTAGTILDGIETGKGTAGMVVKDPKVYQELKSLLKELRAHPTELLFGK